MYQQKPWSVHGTDAMRDGVLHQRLDQKRHQIISILCDLIAYQDLVADFLPVPEMLNLQITSRISQFLSQTHQLILSLQAVAHHLPQLRDNISGVRVLMGTGIHAYGLQRIKQKVRINLVGQHLKFYHSLLVHQPLSVQLVLIQLPV